MSWLHLVAVYTGGLATGLAVTAAAWWLARRRTGRIVADELGPLRRAVETDAACGKGGR